MIKSGGKPLVSIGMTVYNGGDSLNSAIESLLSQDFEDFEFVICDNASTDGTEELCRSYAARDPRITYHRRDHKYEMSDNVQKAFSLAAKGTYYLMCLQDSMWNPQFLRKCVESLDAKPSVVMAIPEIQFINPDGTNCDWPYSPIHTVGMGIRGRIAAIFNQTEIEYNTYGLYRRDVLEKIQFDVKYNGDHIIIMLLLALIGEVEFISGKLFNFRLKHGFEDKQKETSGLELKSDRSDKYYTKQTINMMCCIVNSELPSNLKRILLSDIIQIIAVKNPELRNRILLENPSILQFIEPDKCGNSSMIEYNLIAVFSSLLLPYCYIESFFQRKNDYLQNLSFDDIPVEHKTRPAPGYGDFINTVVTLIEQKNLAQALVYYDEYRKTQPKTEIMQRLDGTIENIRPSYKKYISDNGSRFPVPGKKLRILFQNRANSINMPGGDSVVQKRLQEQLQLRGHAVDFTTNVDVNLSGYDIIHSFNMPLAQELDKFLNNAIKNHKTFVVTSLLEDMPRYLQKAFMASKFFKKYLQMGQQPDAFDEFKEALSKVVPIRQQTSQLAARYAHRLLACGKTEAEYIGQIFPFAKISVAPFGSSILSKDISADLFKQTYGLEDFVLCVGRLEIRKNQLMLLKAMENDTTPVVFADAGFSYDPGYVSLCKAFRRKGPTLFTGRLNDEMLVSAFRSAKVHCLPSWYELPGLVTLEAARYGCATVASSWGAINDYLGDFCEYCEPDSPESIHTAVLNAMQKGPKDGLQEQASKFTWEAAAQRVEDIYYELV